MAVLQYIGARYVPKFYENPDTPGSYEWKSGVPYEPLTIVSYQGDSYTSKITVPGTVGNPADNTTYWAKTGNFNAQLNTVLNELSDVTNFLGDQDLQTESNNVTDAINELSDEIDAIGGELKDLDIIVPKLASTGDCTIIKNNDFAMIIDLGRAPDADTIGNLLIANGITKIDALVITHFHGDHVGDIGAILNNPNLDFSDCTFYLPGVVRYNACVNGDGYIDGYAARETTVVNAITAYGGTIIRPENNTTTQFTPQLSCRWLNTSDAEWVSYGAYSNVINAFGETEQHTIMNNFCMVCDMKYNNTSLLMTADIEVIAERIITPYITGPVNVFKMPHHGVNESADDTFTNKVNPELVFNEGAGYIAHTANNVQAIKFDQMRVPIVNSDYGNFKIVMSGSRVSVVYGSFTETVFAYRGGAITNADNCKGMGIFRVNGVPIDGTITNAYGWLYSCIRGGFGSQLFLRYGGGNHAYIRTYAASTDTFSPWVQLADGTDITTINNKLSGTRKYTKLNRSGNITCGRNQTTSFVFDTTGDLYEIIYNASNGGRMTLVTDAGSFTMPIIKSDGSIEMLPVTIDATTKTLSVTTTATAVYIKRFSAITEQ